MKSREPQEIRIPSPSFGGRPSAGTLGRFFGAIASALLMAGAFPPVERPELAWIAWIPLVYAVRGLPVRGAARIGFTAGLLFWSVSIFWLTKVTVAGWACLSLYCALYFIPFSVFVARWTARFGMRDVGPNLGLIAGGAMVWTGFEYLRYVLFTGYPWNAAGISQYQNIPLIQMAAVGGVSVISAIVLTANLGLAVALSRIGSGRWRSMPELAVSLLLVVGASFHGFGAIRALPSNEDAVRLALIQPAIPQFEKWTPEFVSHIYERLLNLSASAHRAGVHDLLVWPETALPESMPYGSFAHEMVRRVTREGVPLLVGSVEEGGRDERGNSLWFNRSLLVGTNGAVLNHYDKQHLVVYGEYVPFSKAFPFLRALTPMESDVTPGTEPVVFDLPSKRLKFSVLICFEDAIPELSRIMVTRGARLLINQTNDAWFDVSAGSRQHLAQSVFRCVENRVPMARCGNSGLTAWIDETGRIGGGSSSGPKILPSVSPEGRMMNGYLTVRIPFQRGAGASTLFHRHGEWFGKTALSLALLLSLAGAGAAVRNRKRAALAVAAKKGS